MARGPHTDTPATTEVSLRAVRHEEVPDPAGALVSAITLLVRAALDGSVHTAQRPPAEPWLTTAEGARHAAVSEETLREWITLGLLPAGRCGRVLRVQRSDIDALLLERSRVSRAEGDAAGEPTGRAHEILADLGRKNGTGGGYGRSCP